ncbi:hypothetical protein GCM10020331_058070 [Ectobacillus funiculus]
MDGAAVKQVGHLTYEICKEVLDDIVTVPEGKVCTTLFGIVQQKKRHCCRASRRIANRCP